MSTFHGLEMAKQALFAQQSALYTTGHNISNANTEGYTRQRVNFETMNPYPSGSRNRPQILGQMGTGVQAGSVQRVRDQFLDYQYRAESSKSGYWAARADALSRMEGVLNEPSDSGLSHTIDQFWNGLQDLAVNPDNSGARSVVANRGLAVAETFNYLSESLSSIRSDLKNQIDTSVKETNALLRQIHNINEQIKELEPHGYLPNDLYDERDRLIDELSNKMNIKVTYSKSGEGSPEIADGMATIEVVNEKGEPFNPSVVLVNGQTGQEQVNEIEVTYGNDSYAAVSGISVNGQQLDVMNTNGSLKGFIDSYGHDFDGDGDVTGTYTDMLADLDKLANTLKEEFNKVHHNGKALDGSDGIDFFVFKDGKDGAAGITVNKDILDDPDLIAASTNDTDGEGANALNLAEVFNNKNLNGNPLGESTSINSFYQSLIGEMGVKAQEANRMTNNTAILRSQVEDQRMAVSSVSLDEEMSNMIRFQHAYNAAARSMTTMDEMLDKIINSMGLVGR
ncbi:flagellar hook-associated protein FlgK [Virgibacillus salarius]|uniref:flagellar hook-associated protein FlgK n=1 Tax=Virgibacillus salarius TaxID=447199 RepID=UPI0024909F66|nr:flagellar hook-associated protein FlgK [Virgibacillus salarius]WBX78640.1 flagellar hook-associated protein FlgK [Virgibacillus salarius]